MTLPSIRRVVFSAVLPWSSLGFAAVSAGDPIDFRRDVYPILKANCIACHNKTTTKADLNMETPELMKKGGEQKKILVLEAKPCPALGDPALAQDEALAARSQFLANKGPLFKTNVHEKEIP